MMRILIVDDDIYSIEGLKSGLDWEKIGITHLSEAVNVNQAKTVFQSENVDILLCDIEMPGKSGLELLEWILENNIQVVTIFYSCHADFVYAQKALHLKAFNYVLKPSPYEEIEKVLAEAVERVGMNHQEAVRETHYKEWNLNNYEKFYLSCMDGTIPNNRLEIERTSVLQKVDQHMNKKLAIILFSVNDWDSVLKIMNRFDVNFCVKNMANELFTTSEIQKVFTVPYQKRLYAMILEYADSTQKLKEEYFKNRCSRLEKGFYQLFKTSLKYRYCMEFPVEKLGEVTERLVFSLEEQEKTENEIVAESTKPSQGISFTTDLKAWKDNLIHGKREVLYEQVEAYFTGMICEGKTDYYFIETFYHEYSHFILKLLETKKIEVKQILDSLEYKRLQPEARWSTNNLKKYVHLVNRLVMDVLEKEEEPELIDKIKQYIELHIDEELVREKISEEVFINPDYMSRMFRKKTGVPLNQYINERKIEKVKELLDIPGISVSEAAARAGYLNFSYFCQVFKRITGETPSSYSNRKCQKDDE